MTPEAQRIAIAEACGWKYWTCGNETLLLRPNDKWPSYPHWQARGMKEGDGRPEKPLEDITGLPDYRTDLNAMHGAEKVLQNEGGMECVSRYKYSEILFEMCGGSTGPDGENESTETNFNLLHATAAQRAEAFLRTVGKWVE
jgi:hypothetical protein